MTTIANHITAGLPTHAHQLAYDHSVSAGTDHREALAYARQNPAVMVQANETVWTDAEVIEILTDCAEIDQVTDRPLGTWELMRLDQRDWIRRGIRTQ